MSATVYFSRTITPEKVLELYRLAGVELPDKPHLLERIESRNGVHTIEAAAALGYGSRKYELVEVV